jgi:GGDEF domain-containing protein
MAWITLIVGLLIGAVVGIGVAGDTRRWRRSRRTRRVSTPPPSVEHVLDLVRRAHNAKVVYLCGLGSEPIAASGPNRLEKDTMERLRSLAKLSMGDGREHVIRGYETMVAVGDKKLGAAVVLGQGDSSPEEIHEVSSELRRLLAELQADLGARLAGARAARPTPVDLPPRLDTLPAIASGLCDRARIITGRPAAVVVRNPETQTAAVLAVSGNADRRLLGIPVAPDSAVGRACMGDGTIAAGTDEDLFGRVPANRRRKTGQGTAYPLRDGREGVGALVVFGAAEELDPAVLERVMWLAVDTGPRFAAAAALQAAEERAGTDSLTGLPNRAGLNRVLAGAPAGPCAILCVDVDHLKRINDELGDVDMAARIGGEEFVVWLPETERDAAAHVAERIRQTVADTAWEWAGSTISLTCSIGLAARPDTSPDLENLIPAADAALARAKRGGRNRVEVASAPGQQPG